MPSDERQILLCVLVALAASHGIALVLGVLWGEARSLRRLRTPRLLPLAYGDAVERI